MPSRPQIVGILNLTPDSFSDGGRYHSVDHAVAAAHQMLTDGADILDLGGESTRPGASRIPADEQLRRVLPVLEQLRDHRISIDTTLAPVARAALDAGASIINDISAGREDPGMFPLAAARQVPVILMHMQGNPATMQQAPHYDNVVVEVRDFLLQRAQAALAAGIKRENIILDPGLGFGKTTEHNLQLLAHLRELVDCGYTILLGASRKRFLGEITHTTDPADRIAATLATTVIGTQAGVQMFRVHDVRENRRAADVTFATLAHQ